MAAALFSGAPAFVMAGDPGFTGCVGGEFAGVRSVGCAFDEPKKFVPLPGAVWPPLLAGPEPDDDAAAFGSATESFKSLGISNPLGFLEVTSNCSCFAVTCLTISC